METTLNLIWLAITVAAVWLWRFRWAVSRRNPRHSTRMKAVAMVCVLALLFPVISLTDDLHPEIALVDAASGKRNASLIAAISSHVPGTIASSGKHLAVGMILGSFVAPNLVITEFIPRAKFHDPSSFAGSSPGRSPPSLQ